MKHIASAAFVSALLFAQSASAVVVLTTDSSGYTGPQLDLSGYTGTGYNFTFGPELLPGGITFTAAPGGGGNSGQGSVVGQGSYGLGDNGSFGGDAVYIGVDSATGYAELTFSTLISSFGGFWNYFISGQSVLGDDPTIWALNDLGDILGEFNLLDLAAISTPGGFNDFAFRGILSDAADIRTIRFGGSYILLAGTADGSVPTSPVPVPAGGLLLIGALGGLAALRRRKAA